MLTSSLPKQSANKAAALIIVLAFVVLLTGLTLTYFSRTTTERQLAHSSYNDTSSNLMARNALDIIISNLKQEIVNGSTTLILNGSPLYTPLVAANMVPQKSGNVAGVANLIRRSVRNDSLTGNPGLPSLASQVNSTSDVSANGHFVTAARWNAHYLVPKKNTGTGDSIPIDAFANATPDWVFVTNAGPGVIIQPSASIIGRYAYAVYDEGGLLDMNAAGYPSPTTILQYGRKGSLAFADLTALPGLSTAAVDNLVGWRNYASSQPSGTLSSNFSFTSNAANTYYNFILSDPTNIQLTNYLVPTPTPLNYFTNCFLTPSGAITPSPSPPGASPTPPSRTDQLIIARQELIDLRSGVSSGISFSNALQSLGTFSREALANVPQWIPSAPDTTNPNFQTLLATGSFTRNDGTTANTGDPYINKRFFLERLNWLTYRGPSATRTIPASAPALGNADYDMWLLTRGAALTDMNSIRFGLTSAFLQQGTAANILKYFGLAWDATNERWNYTSPSGGSLASSIATLGTLTGTREPDFFELLQAGILNSSVGDTPLYSDPALPSVHEASKLLHILTIGANLIAQSRADSYPVRIACTVGGTTMEAVGMPRLPCLSSLAVCPAGSNQGNGGVNWFLIPNLWDPFRDTWDLTEANANNALSTPGYLRPPVRITVQGTIGFGRATASQSGSVNPASVFSFLTLPTINSSLTLQTGATSPAGLGRDGLLEAKRLGMLDINTSVSPVSSFVPTNSATGSSWNTIIRPANDTSTYRTDEFVVYRASIQGSQIPNGSTGFNPVLILPTGFQITLDYQSPNGQWYSYSFLQGNNATNTWITASPGLCLATSFSQYGSGPKPTIVNVIGGAQSLWTDVTGPLAHSPMFAKADPRSIRYNSMIGVVNVANPPLPFNSAGVIGPIWPSQYATPPSMTPSGFPNPTPTANANPATVGDNAPATNAANPYSELVPTPTPTPPTPNASLGDNWRPVMMNRPFRSVGEMAYAFRDQPFRTLSFSLSNSPDAGLLDLFTTNDYTLAPTPTPTGTPAMRAGVISLNSAQSPALASVLTSTIRREDTPRSNDVAPGPSPSVLNSTTANSVATSLTSSTINNPLINRAGLATLIANANPVGFDATVPKTQRESIARAFGETVQTRTWNLLIDMIAQSGHYKPDAGNLQNDFVVEGEEHYWVHVAIDRFTGQVIDKQIEKVNE